MKILLSAYACEPGKGSEPEVGLRTALVAAQTHDVWVITRENNLPTLRAYLKNEQLAERIHLIGLDVPGPGLRLKKRYGIFSQLYYDRWQRALADRAVELDRRIRFDLTHHVTFAAYWKRTGVAAVRRPFVWGPVGGGVRAPLGLYGELGVRGIVERVARDVARPVIAMVPTVRLPQRRAAVVLTQNPETARRITSRYEPIVMPNALAVRVPKSEIPPARQLTVVCVAGLIPLKGVRLAVQSFAAVRTSSVRMVVIGQGVELRRIQRMAASLGVLNRITFTGRLPREEVLRIVASASVLIHAALHEEAGLAVSEALSYGTPVVCLDRGGPPQLLKYWPDVPSHAVPPRSRRKTVRALANALDDVLADPPAKTAIYSPSQSYDATVLNAYKEAVIRG